METVLVSFLKEIVSEPRKSEDSNTNIFSSLPPHDCLTFTTEYKTALESSDIPSPSFSEVIYPNYKRGIFGVYEEVSYTVRVTLSLLSNNCNVSLYL